MRKIIGKLIIILSLLVLAYPFVSKYYLEGSNDHIAKNYYNKEIGEEELEERERAREEYNRSLLEGAFNAEGEFKELNLKKTKLISGDLDPIGILYIPRLEEEIPLYMGTSDAVLNVGVGVVENTSIPGGVGTNSVISGHRGTHKAKIFRHLDKMEDGDLFYVIMDGKVFKYEIRGSDIVQPDAASSIEVDPYEDKVTLLTCTPYLVNTERLLIYGYREELTAEDTAFFASKFNESRGAGELAENNFEMDERAIFVKTIITLSVLFVVLVILIILLPLIFGKRKKKEKKEKVKEVTIEEKVEEIEAPEIFVEREDEIVDDGEIEFFVNKPVDGGAIATENNFEQIEWILEDL